MYWFLVLGNHVRPSGSLFLGAVFADNVYTITYPLCVGEGSVREESAGDTLAMHTSAEKQQKQDVPLCVKCATLSQDHVSMPRQPGFVTLVYL
jgi:hypothetical protein